MADRQKINIELDDLKDVEAPSAARVFPGLSSDGRENFRLDLSTGKSKKSYLLQMSEGIAVPRALAGFFGGTLAWLFTEVATNQDAVAASAGHALFETMIWCAAIGGFIGGTIRASEDLYAGRNGTAIKSFFLGGLVGIAAGAAAGLFAQIIYSILGGGLQGTGVSLQILARTIAFGAVGGLTGLGLALPSGIGKKIKAAALGGLAGGLIGGFLFDTLGGVLAYFIGGGGTVSRAIGLVITGSAIGYGMGITENLYRDAWLQVTGGPFSGKQFIIYKNETWIGRDPACDIVLVKDTYVSPRHCLVVKTPSGYELRINSSVGAQAAINGALATHKALTPGDVIQIGQSQFVFRASTGKKKAVM